MNPGPHRSLALKSPCGSEVHWGCWPCYQRQASRSGYHRGAGVPQKGGDTGDANGGSTMDTVIMVTRTSHYHQFVQPLLCPLSSWNITNSDEQCSIGKMNPYLTCLIITKPQPLRRRRRWINCYSLSQCVDPPPKRPGLLKSDTCAPTELFSTTDVSQSPGELLSLTSPAGVWDIPWGLWAPRDLRLKQGFASIIGPSLIIWPSTSF